jgi:DNA-directed RNA polymerase beta' subunit
MFGKYLTHFYNDFLSGNFWLKKQEKKIESKVEIKIKESKNIQAPAEYIDCKLENISVEGLHQKYNIVLKSISIENKLFVQSLILLNEPKEFDCYADGENASIEIKEIDDNLLSVLVKEKSGNQEKFYIRDGKIEIKL